MPRTLYCLNPPLDTNELFDFPFLGYRGYRNSDILFIFFFGAGFLRPLPHPAFRTPHVYILDVVWAYIIIVHSIRDAILPCFSRSSFLSSIWWRVIKNFSRPSFLIHPHHMAIPDQLPPVESVNHRTFHSCQFSYIFRHTKRKKS